MNSRGRGRVYEAYEVKNKRQKLRCLLLRRKKKNIFYLFMKSLLWKKFLNGAVITTVVASVREVGRLQWSCHSCKKRLNAVHRAT
jgi:hypothetical protein